MTKMAQTLTTTPPTTTRTARLSAWFERRMPVLLVLPAVILLLGLGLIPLLYSLGISFTNWNLQDPVQQFKGLMNYGDVLGDQRMLGALRNTAIFMVCGVTVETLLGLGLAQTLVGHLPGKRFITPLLILPAVVSPIVVGFTWRMLYDASYGPIDHILSLIRNQPTPIVWLVNLQTVYPAVLLTEIWQWTPFMFLVMLAGLTAVSPELLEAASVDGASAWQIFTRITLPVIRPVVIVAILFRALDIFKLFDIIVPLTGGGPGTTTETASLYLYILGFKNFRLGYTAAASYIILILFAVLLTLLLRRISKETD
jgi:multiple sugar transport system permease protein